jgi:ABC-type glycerol-3-phosphate transport system substrate-binding protein
VILGGIGLIVAACGGGGGTSTNSTIQLAFWKPPGLPTNLENQFYSNLLATFHKENPNIYVTHLVIPWASASEKYTSAFASNNPPDVSYQILNWVNNFLSQNVLMPIEELDSSGNLFKGVFPAYAKGSLGPDGKHYGVPYYGSQWVLTVNQANWTRAGKPAFPKTYEQMVTFAQALTFDANGKQLGQPGFDKNHIATYGYLQASDTPTLINYIWNYLWAYGVDYVSKDGKDIGFDNPQGRAALTVMKDMVDSGAATPFNLYPDSQSALDAFLSGKIAMSWFQNFDPNTIQQYKNTQLLVLPVPAGPAGQFLTGGAGYLTVSKKSSHPAEDLKLIQFLTQEGNVRDYLRETRLSPVKPMGDTLYKGIGPDEAFMNASVQQAKYVHLTRIGLPYDPQDIIVSEIINYLSGRKSIDRMLQDLHHEVQLMARNAGM